jgi:hypothetical protein
MDVPARLAIIPSQIQNIETNRSFEKNKISSQQTKR